MDRELLRVEDLPVLQNKVYPSAEAARSAPRGRMVLAQSQSNGLIFNGAFDPDLLSYDADYQNEQACSPVFREHLGNVLGIVRRHFRTPSLIEVGCGKGYFLAHLRAAGYDATGIDPAYEGDSPHVVKAAFSEALGMTSDAIVLRHVLEHIQDPLSFLRAVARANGGQGKIYIEVPCFDWICERRAWFDIFYEHVNYFRAADFRRMFGQIDEMGHLFGGQYQYVVADLSSLRVLAPEASGFALPAGPQGHLGRLVQGRDLCAPSGARGHHAGPRDRHQPRQAAEAHGRHGPSNPVAARGARRPPREFPGVRDELQLLR
jgi:SAM-dependent methyltransferase